MPTIKQKHTLLTLFEQIDRGVSPSGEHVYEWEYLDPETGNLKQDKKNVFEMIQSYAGRVDYKTQILKGELNTDANIANIYQDYRGIPDSTVDIIDHLNYLANLPQEQVTNLLEQIAKANQASIPSKQTNDQTIDGTTTGDTADIQK